MKFSEQGNKNNKVSFRCIKWSEADKRRHYTMAGYLKKLNKEGG